VLIQKENTATYDETMSGMHEFLKTKPVGQEIIIKNGKNNDELMRQIASAYAQDANIKLVIVLGSSAVTIVNQVVKNKPILFGGINHPDGLGIGGDNITGTTYYINPKSMIAGVKQILPAGKKAGILYEPPEQNAASKVEVPETEKACQAAGITSFAEAVTVKAEIIAKTKQLLDKGVEMIIIPTNALLYNNVDLIRTLADAKKVPVISFSKKGLENGALFGLTSDNKRLGNMLGEMVYAILKERKTPQDLPYKMPYKYSFVVNIKTAKALGITVPVKMLKIAEVLQ
jgi:putative ABC transport system substrate-binding protein